MALLGTLCWFPLRAGPKVFEFDTDCQQAYQQIFSLHLAEGRALLDQERREHPGNLIPYFLDNYIDLIRLFFTEDPDQYSTLLPLREKRLDLMEQGDPHSPYYLFTRAVIHYQWSLIRIKFGERWDATWDFRRAYLLLKRNQSLFPQFSPDFLFLGAMETVIGTIPSGYRWITEILGLSGSVGAGMNAVTRYLNDPGPDGSLFRWEADFYYCYLMFYIERKPEVVFQFIHSQKLDSSNSRLFSFMVANLALNDEQGEYALDLMRNCDTGRSYQVIPALDYDLGLAYLDRLDLDSSIVYFKRYTQEFKGNFYLKDALQKLSWAYFLKGDRVDAEFYRSQVLHRGNAVTDADKSALLEAQQDKFPDPDLLRPRLLTDGGYYQQGLQLLIVRDVQDFPTYVDKVEYAYRLGRVYDQLGQPEKAIPFYLTTIKAGKTLPEYFAARAAWQLGMIYEQKGDTARALGYYHQCLRMPEREYKNSLDQWAKSGINRLGGN